MPTAGSMVALAVACVALMVSAFVSGSETAFFALSQSDIDDIENEIFNLEAKEVESTTIGEIVMDKIKDLDQVAYVRFASVYREFKDVNTFMNELSKLLSANSDKK